MLPEYIVQLELQVNDSDTLPDDQEEDNQNELFQNLRVSNVNSVDIAHQDNRRIRGHGDKNPGKYLLAGMGLRKIQETIDEIQRKMDPREASALKALRKREAELRNRELLANVEAAWVKKKRPKRREYQQEDSSNSEEESSDSDSDAPGRGTSPILRVAPPEGHRTVQVNTVPPLQPFLGKQTEDWQKFKKQITNVFSASRINEAQAAQQFCSYIDGNAYMFWNSLPEETKESLPKTFRAFDKKYADKIKQEYWT